jgi:hypothetical protein
MTNTDELADLARRIIYVLIAGRDPERGTGVDRRERVEFG